MSDTYSYDSGYSRPPSRWPQRHQESRSAKAPESKDIGESDFSQVSTSDLQIISHALSAMLDGGETVQAVAESVDVELKRRIDPV